MNRVLFLRILISTFASLSLGFSAFAAEPVYVNPPVKAEAKIEAKVQKQDSLKKKSEAEESDSSEGDEVAQTGPSYTHKVLTYVASPFAHALISVQGKVDELKVASETRDRLVLENANLRMKLELSQYSCQVKDAQTFTKVTGDHLQVQTGSREGRALASLHYQIPGDLAAGQLYTLGVSYFKAKEDEKSAAIFSMLSGMEDSTQYQTAKVFVLAGTSWYRLSNFDMAKSNFQKALAVPATEENQEYQAQARLWKAVIAQRSNEHIVSQTILKELLEHNPHSTEAAWANGNDDESREAKRATAAISDSKK